MESNIEIPDQCANTEQAINQKTQDNVNIYCEAGLYLVPIPPINGQPTKAPLNTGWNKPLGVNNQNGYSNNPDDFKNCEGFNFGLYHDASNTMALDLDDLEIAQQVFKNTADIPIKDWLTDNRRVEIKSPKSNRGKLLFKVPPDINLKLRQFKHENEMVFELRAGNCQDVILGQHPEGGDYQLIGNPANTPDIPEILLDMLLNWDDWKPCLDSALGIDIKPPKTTPKQSQQTESINGHRCPIAEFNQSYSCSDVLIRNGFVAKGKDRFIRPNSSSKAPGVAIMNNCTDGIERVFSHGGDVLNDGYAHDAFDCYRLLECNGEW